MRRAIGIIRVSRQGDRDDENFHSPDIQRKAIERTCADYKLRLVETYDEINVSGGKALSKRTKGLLKAVEMIEANEADAIVVSYFDRLLRNSDVWSDVKRRVEAAGGDIYSTDLGKVTNGKAMTKFAARIGADASELLLDLITEKSAEGQAAAIAKGHVPVKLIPGLLRDCTGTIALDPAKAPAMAEMVRLRARGQTIDQCRAYLAEQGIEMSWHGVTNVLRREQLIGKIKFGKHVFTVPAIIDAATFRDAQKRHKVRRGRMPVKHPEALLSRLRVLRCGTCGSTMVAATAGNGKYRTYRCGDFGRIQCTQGVTISMPRVDAIVINAVKKLLKDMRGTASPEYRVMQANSDLISARTALEDFAAVWDGSDVEAAKQRRADLERTLTAAQERYDVERSHANATLSAIRVDDWDKLTRVEQRDLIVAVIETVEVMPGSGDDRVRVTVK